MFPNARGLLVTATPLRADGKGLGRHADGIADVMIVGPSMRQLIEWGFLTDYRIFAPPSDIDMTPVTITDSGEFSPPKLKLARSKSHITGDVVTQYLRIAAGKKGVTFDTDVDNASDTAEAFRAKGIPAEMVQAKTPEALRRQIIRRFRHGDLLQLVNVDLFGEGFDLPAIEVVSMARPTASYGLYVQQFGRALRTMEGKLHAIIIDHVGNVEKRHGLPDAPRQWSLDRRERGSRGKSDAMLLRTCLNPECMGVYERFLLACPYCGTAPTFAQRSAPQFVDGDLHELDPSVLQAMRGEIERIDAAPRVPGGVPAAPVIRAHEARQQAQKELRAAIALWAGWQSHLGYSLPEIWRRFYLTFGIDTNTAQCLGALDAATLETRIEIDLQRNNVVQLT